MIIEQTKLDGVLLIKPTIYEDERGCFFESYRDDNFKNIGLSGKFSQDNQTKSKKGILRGLHYQLNYPQGKLVRVSLGEVYDVAVDIRLNSPTFGQYYGTLLSDNNHFQMYVPPGFAHGYIVRSEIAIFQYKCTEIYHPEDEYGIRWNDPQVSIDWDITNPIICDRDKEFPLLSNQKNLPMY
jgi:dTDP-4-dehydrorhamnose 3,5-epimerase